MTTCLPVHCTPFPNTGFYNCATKVLNQHPCSEASEHRPPGIGHGEERNLDCSCIKFPEGIPKLWHDSWLRIRILLSTAQEESDYAATWHLQKSLMIVQKYAYYVLGGKNELTLHRHHSFVLAPPHAIHQFLPFCFAGFNAWRQTNFIHNETFWVVQNLCLQSLHNPLVSIALCSAWSISFVLTDAFDINI